MGFSQEEREAIVTYRLERAKETLMDAQLSIQNSRWNSAANRLYYACFYAAVALLISDGHQAHTHNGVKTLLGMHYIKTGIIPETIGPTYQKAFNLRQTGDYDDLAFLTEQDVTPLLKLAEQFVNAIESIIYKSA